MSKEIHLLRIRKIEDKYKYASGKQCAYVVEAIIDGTFYALVYNEEIELDF